MDAQFEGHEAVFGKAKVEEGGHGDGGSAELLLLFGEVGTTDVADSAFVAETGEKGVHFWRDSLDSGVSWDFWHFLGERRKTQGMRKSLFGGMVRLLLQTLCELKEREYIVNGFC